MIVRIITTYHREHGLQGEEFTTGAALRMSDGRLCFGGPGGFNVFDPHQLAAAAQPPRIALTGMEILGAPVHDATPNWLLQRVTLDYRASVVSFDFAALDFTSPRRNRLAYRVSQLTDKWIDLASSRRVTLTNLPAGDHVLEVRAANADSVWSSTPFRLTIHKAAAPWASAPAYIVYALLAIGLAFWLARAQRAKLRRALAAKQQLEAEVALRTKELREANQQLIVASEAKSDFLARMGHELRTPMNGVVGMSELIARSPLSVTQARQIQTIRSSAKTLLQILNDLLDLSKAQAGKTVLESLPLDINLLMEECVAMFTGAAEAKGIDLIVCPALPTKLEPHGDPLRMRQLLMNLVGNAVKFTEHGEVVVTCNVETFGTDTLQLTLNVTDTGVGISAAACEKIFEPFTQADETTTRRFGGTGLGLSICHELTTLMGGRISVASKPGKGSTFTIDIPLKAEARAPRVRPEGMDGAVLLVSERRSLIDSLERNAAWLGLRCRPVAADSAAASDEYDIVILDADRHAEQINQFSNGPLRNRTIVVASPAAIESLGLESQVEKYQLLRNPIHREAFALAISTVRSLIQGATCADAVAAPTDVTGTYQFPLIPARVLIVEDDEVNGTVAEGYLKMLGCSSEWFKNGQSAVERCQTESFDLILMDLNMPGLDGYETTRRIRTLQSETRRIPIIALTANKASAHRDECLLSGMDDILSKPYSLAELTGVLRRWVDVSKPLRRADSADGSPPDLTRIDGVDLADVGRSNPMLYLRLVQLFAAGAGKALATIDSALRSQDLEAARQAAHKLKGAAGNVGALEFAAQLSRLEACCSEGNTAMANHTTKLLRAALPALLAALTEHSQRASA